MATSEMTAFWIESPLSHAPLGFGVTARSLSDALQIIRALGYGRYLPNDLDALKVTKGITVAQLDQPYVVAHMGPIVVRGLWYPFVTVGVPALTLDDLLRGITDENLPGEWDTGPAIGKEVW